MVKDLEYFLGKKIDFVVKMFMELAMIDGYIDPRERDLFESL